jgi:hypothetical protein
MFKNLYRTALCITGLSFSLALAGQNEMDVLRYSRTQFGGTARFMGMAGSFGAVGADISMMSANPGGLGMFRKNELVFSPSFQNVRVNSMYNGSENEDVRFNFKVDNFGFVFNSPAENKTQDGWQSFTFGLAYNRINTFQSNQWMGGNDTTSMMDHWKRTASGSGPYQLNSFYELLAWNTWLLNHVPGDTTQYVDTIPAGDLLYQEKFLETRGGMSEWTFGVGANYGNKLYIGATVGIANVRYEQSGQYSEEEVIDSTSTFDYLLFDESIEVEGRGFNFKAGFIYRPIDLLRIGFSVQTPTNYKLTEVYQTSMTSVLGGVVRKDFSPEGTFNYSVRTPLRMTGSVAFIFGKIGLINVDYEMLDYSSARLKAQDYGYLEENKAVREKYKNTGNLRIGGELRLLPFYVRGGFAYYGSPYVDEVNNDASRRYITTGAGYRNAEESFFVDFAIVTMNSKENYFFYDQSLVNPVLNKWNMANVVVTVGFKY